MIIILVLFIITSENPPWGSGNKVCMYVNVFLQIKFTDLLRHVIDLKTLTSYSTLILKKILQKMYGLLEFFKARAPLIVISRVQTGLYSG